MKNVLSSAITVTLLFAASAFALFTAGTSSDSKLQTSLMAPAAGQYSITFDYRFTGIDNFTPADNFALAGLEEKKNTQYTMFEADSSTGLTDNQSYSGDWHTITLQPVTLEAWQKYGLGFEHNDDLSLNRHDQPITLLDVDDVSLMKVRAVPAPGAILLCSIGAGLVGWLRYRRAL